MAIYFFDKNQTLIKIVPESATFEAIQTQELDDDSLLKDTLSVTVKGDEKLLNAEYMAVKSYTGNAQTFDMYRIVTDTTPDKSMSFTGMSLAPYELNGHIIQDLRPVNQTISYTLIRVLDGTDWHVGYVEDGLSNITTNFYYVSAKEALKELQSLIGCEFVFKVEISGQKITDKWIEVYKEMGNRTKKRFNYGTNALTVVRETNKADIYTALIGRGKGEEVSSGEDNESGQAGYGRKITFEDIEWSTAKGNPLNKPIGQYYLELPQATQAYGIKNIDGTMKARVGIVDFDDEEDKNRLINLTYQQLLVSSRPKVLFKTTVANIGATGIGDTVTIHRHDLGIHYQTRVRKIVRNKLNDNKTQIELGDAVVTASTKRAKQNNATIKSLNQEIEKVKADVTISQTSADGKNTINYGSAEPERQRTGDTWYRPHPSIAGETQMLVWNGTAWELVIDTSDLTSVSREVKDAIDRADEAKGLAVSEAESALAQAKADATAKANAIHEQISGEVNTAISTAEDAKALAISEAENALAQAKADATAKANAVKEEVSTSVNTAISTAETAKQTAIDNYTNAVAEAERLVGEQTTSFDKKFGDIEDSVDTVNQSVSDADAKAEAIKQGLGLADINLTNQQITDQIMSDYNTVKQNSTNALTDAGKALTDAYNAQQAADGIIEDFNTFLTGDFASVENDIVTAQTTATDALNKAGTAVSDLDTFKIDYNTFITDTFNPAFTTATDALSLAEQNKGLFYSANLIDEETGQSNVYTKAQIDGTNGYVTKSTFNQNAESISSELERVEGVALASGANINLLVVKNAKNNTWLDTNPSSRTYPTPNDTTNATATSPDLISVTAGEKITLSKTTVSGDNNFRIDFLNSSKSFVSRLAIANNTQTITIPANVEYMWVSYPMDSYPKIERGEVKTQWTLAPQDQVNQSTINYFTSKINQTPELISEALLAYTPTDSLDDTVSSYLSNNTTKTAGAIDTKLTSYAKTTALNGLATEEYATNKATETANGVKNELVAVIGTKVDSDTLDGYVSQATYDTGVEGISKSISTVEGKIPTAIGGRNLLRGTANFNTPLWRNVTTAIPSTRDSRYKQVRVDGDFTVAPITTMATQEWNFEAGEDYVVSVYAKSEVLGNKLGLTAQSTIYFEPQVVAVSEWRRYVWKFKATISNLANFRFETRNGERVWITQPQVEKGTILTDWTLAPEDLQTIDALDSNIVSLYNNTSSETSKAISQTLTAYVPTDGFDNKTKTYLTNNNYQTAEMVTATLTSYTPTNSLDAKTQSYLTNNSYQTAQMVETKLASYQTKTDLDGSVASILDNTESKTAGKINSKLTDIQAQIPTEFGGRNLLRGTADFDTTLWRNVSTAIPSTRDSRYKQVRVDGDFNVAPITTMSVQGWNFEIGKEYVISVWAKSEVLGNKLGVTAQSTPYFEPQVVGVSEWRRYVWKFTATMSNLTNFRFETRNGERVWITQPQIEKGSIPTDWTRAVEDLATVVQTNEIERTANYTKSAITNVTKDGLVTGSTINQTKDGITERVARLDTNGNVAYANRDVKLDSIVSTVANDKYISNIIQASDLVQSTIRENTNVDLLAKAASGTGMTADPNFNKGINGLTVYDSGNTNTISIYRNLTNDPNLPSGKGYRLDIYHASSTSTSPYRGGVALPTQSWANGVVVVRFTAKLDVGKSFVYAQNSIGTGSTHGWLTSNKGTGNWEQYAYYYRFGASGTFQTFGFLAVNATSAAFTWRLADFDIINLGLSSQSQITQLQDNINLKVSKEGLINQINISAGGTLIQSGTNKLNITPETTYIKDATIKSAMIDSIDVKQIKGITADFTSMVTKALTANTISSTMIHGNEALFEKLFSNDMATTKLAAQEAWIKDSNIVSLDAGKIKAGEIDTGRIKSGEVVAKGLVADVVKSTHIESSTGLIDKIFANEALITRLTSNSIFASKIKAIEIDASKITSGELAAARIKSKDVVSQGLTADVIQATHIKAEAGLVDKIFSKTAYIEELTNKSIFTEKIQAINISADKITTGTLDAGKVKVINIDAENITANKTEFIKTNWNEATGGGVTITGGGVRAINSEGSRVTLENGVVSVGNRSGVNLGFFGDHVLNKDATGTMTITASLGTETAFISATSADGKTYKRSMSIMSGAGEIDMFTTLDMNKNSLKDVTDIGFTGGLIKGSINGAARYMTIEAGTGTAFDVSGVTRMSITSVVNIFSGIDMKGKDIANVGKLTYNSDQRLKTNIKDTDIRALDAIRNWQLVSYDWLENGEHVEIGLIAQNSPEVMTYNAESDIYGIDAGKQTMINTLAIQQLDSKTDNEISQLKAQIASLQDELATLKGD